MQTRTATHSPVTRGMLRPSVTQRVGHKQLDNDSQRGQILTTRVGLALPDNLTYDDWKQAAPKLFRIADSAAWCLGDWLVYGQRKYTDRYRTAAADAGLDYQTLRNYAWVSRKFDVSRRRENLSFQHHAEVASLPVEEQDRWLDLAQKNGWTRQQLRKNVRDIDDERETVVRFIPRVQVKREELSRWQEAAAKSASTFRDWIVSALNEASGLNSTKPGEDPSPSKVENRPGKVARDQHTV